MDIRETLKDKRRIVIKVGSSSLVHQETGELDFVKIEKQARRRKIANDLKKCESEIARLEEEGEKLDEEVSLPENSTDPDKLRQLTAKREDIDRKLGELYEQWELLSEQAEEDS